MFCSSPRIRLFAPFLHRALSRLFRTSPNEEAILVSARRREATPPRCIFSFLFVAPCGDASEMDLAYIIPARPFFSLLSCISVLLIFKLVPLFAPTHSAIPIEAIHYAQLRPWCDRCRASGSSPWCVPCQSYFFLRSIPMLTLPEPSPDSSPFFRVEIDPNWSRPATIEASPPPDSQPERPASIPIDSDLIWTSDQRSCIVDAALHLAGIDAENFNINLGNEGDNARLDDDIADQARAASWTIILMARKKLADLTIMFPAKPTNKTTTSTPSRASLGTLLTTGTKLSSSWSSGQVTTKPPLNQSRACKLMLPSWSTTTGDASAAETAPQVSALIMYFACWTTTTPVTPKVGC